MSRRAFITSFGGTAVWPLSRAQQPKMTEIGFFDPTSSDTFEGRLRGFRQGSKKQATSKARSWAIVYCFAENQMDRVPQLAADLVRAKSPCLRRLPPARWAAKTATTTIRIVLLLAEDPVKVGLVRPNGNLTGIYIVSAELAANRFGFVRELVPATTRIAVLLNPTGANSETNAKSAARSMRHSRLLCAIGSTLFSSISTPFSPAIIFN
jgi:putative tryptophan/tyrosine transport system substrate-binding protein